MLAIRKKILKLEQNKRYGKIYNEITPKQLLIMLIIYVVILVIDTNLRFVP
jgi:hypothetical protein